MKYIILLVACLLAYGVNAQIEGNGEIITKRLALKDYKKIDIGLYATYEIELGTEPYLEITVDRNLLDKVEKSVKGQTLHIDQLEWIRSSKPILVRVGGREVTHIKQSSHASTSVRNINQSKFNYNAEVGKISLMGKAQEVALKVGTASIDATELEAETGSFSFDSWGEIKASIKGEHSVNKRDQGRLFINGVEIGKGDTPDVSEIRFIKFTLKNNSANRHQFYVVGPKPDGSSFSYGFPMMPFQTRDKDWTNGTKVYKVNRLGVRSLVTTISLSDEGKTVNIFSK